MTKTKKVFLVLDFFSKYFKAFSLKPYPSFSLSGKYRKNTRNVMIFMTDGANTKSKTDKTHDGNDEGAANKLSIELCQKINSEEIEVFSIAYDMKNASAKRILRNCASEKEMFFDARNAGELEKAFQEIGASLFKVRLTH